MKLRKEKFTTPSGIVLKDFYEGGDATGSRPPPGEFPYTRGVHRTMYRGRLWTMRQYAGFGSAREANERYRFLLAHGTTGLSVAFDLPTQMGRDSDHAVARGEVGRVGVAISSLEDMMELFEGIPLDKVSISMTINSTAAILLALLLVVAERRQIPWSSLTGTIQNDILKEYIARGTYIFPPAKALRIVTDIFGFCSEQVPQWNTINVSGYHIREAGSTAVQEIAFTLADGIAYMEAAIGAGLAVDVFAPRVAFFFNCHNDFLEEIAKFRAARRMWARIMSERFGARDPRSLMLRFHTQTAGSSLTAQQPMNNIVRTAVQALAAVCGGTQSLHTNSYDEALCLPTEESATIALRTQQIIAHESGVAQIADPLGGSHAIEYLTDEIEREALAYLEKIETLGGMLKAIEGGFPQAEIERSAYAYQQAIESGEQIIVGVNDYRSSEGADEEPVLQKIDPEIERAQCARLRSWRAGRDTAVVGRALERVRAVAGGTDNLMPPLIDAVRAGATLGEISDALRSELGEM